MALQSTPSFDSTLGPVDDDPPSAEPPSSQLESFPPLYITRSNVMNSPSLTLEPVVSSRAPSVTEHGLRRWWILCLSCLLLFGNYFGKKEKKQRVIFCLVCLRCSCELVFIFMAFWVLTGA
jgi:hypothetical protein